MDRTPRTDGRPQPGQRRIRTTWLVAAFVVLVLVVATLLITARFDGEGDVPDETDVGAPALDGAGHTAAPSR